MQLRRYGLQLLVLLMTLTAFDGWGSAEPWPCPPTTNSSTTTTLRIATTGQECDAALRGIDALVDLVTDDNARMLGFEKHEDLSSPHVTIGEPFHLYQVDLLDLRHFNPANPASDNVTALLKLNSSLLIYPLLTQRLGDLRPQTRSAVVVSRKGMTWRPTNWGLAELAQAMAAYRTRPGFEGSSVVWIPALNLHFLGDNPNREDLMLIPLADRLAYGIRQGEEISAKTVFTFYAREASSLDEKTPG